MCQLETILKFSPLLNRNIAAARLWLVMSLAISLLVGPFTAGPYALAAVAGHVENNEEASQGSYFCPTDKSFVHKYLKPGEYMPLSEVRPGMVGYGLTVFHGTKVERFKVEIISVVKQILNGRDAILARLSGGEMAKNCVIKGMSGSPCYINGKLIGAVSFGFDFEKEPIAGITPIVDMLDALTDGVPASKGASIPISHLSAPSWSIQPSQAGITNTSGGALHMIPLVSPVSLVGFSSRAESFLSDRFKDIGMGVTSGSSGGMDSSLPGGSAKDLQPGSAVSVLLASGDFSIAATGTATTRFGDKVIAFGHPFMQGGAIDFPMATAYVHQVMPSLAVSFKMASPVSVVGSVTADRPWGIGGKLGRVSRMIPATYTVIDETRHVQHTYHCSVIDHPEMTPELLAATATSALDATHQTAGPYVAKVESRIEADGIQPIVRTDRFSTGMAPKSFMDMFMGGDPVGRFVNRSTSQLANNEFQKAAIKNISLKIVLQDGHQTAKIDRVYIDKAYAAPGEDVKVTAVLKPFNAEPIQETMTFKVPRDVPDGNMLIGIAGGQDYDYIKSRLGIVDPEPENLKQIAKRIQDEGRGDQISLVVGLPEQSLMVNGTKLVNPPAYWTKVFYSNRHTKGPTLVKGEMKLTKDEPWMLFGSHIIALEVRSPDKASARTAPYPISAPYNNDDVAITEQARKTLDSFPAVGRKTPSRGGSSAGIVVTGSTTNIPASGSSSSSSGTASGSTTSKTASTSTSIIVSSGKDYPHVRPLQIWREDSEEEFRAGKLDDTTVDSWGRISPGFQSLADKQVSTEDQIWSGVWSNGYFYYGSADSIWRWSADAAKPEKVAKLDGLFIPSITLDSRGIIYATAVPSGKVWAIDTKAAKMAPQVIFTASEPIITSLAVDDKDNLYVGTAGTGKVYKVDPAHHSNVLFDSAQAHVLCMFYSKREGTLYIGTGEKGSVYALDKTGKARAVYQSPDHFVTGIVKDAKGDLYVASAASGHLVRVIPSGEATTLATSDAFYTLHYDEATDSMFSGDAEGDITMACLDPITRQPYFMPVSHTEQEAVLALASDGKNLYAGTSNLAVLRSFRMQLSTKPMYTSAVKDAGRTAQWSKIRTYGPFNELNNDLAAKLKIETRTGETAKPDETWSPWTPAQLKDDSFSATSPTGRYFQYKLVWNTSNDKLGPEKIDRLALGRIDAIYLPTNTAPQISTISLKSGTAIAGKHDLSVTGTDADGDNLLASIDVSSDGGTTWKPLKDDIRSKSAKKDAKSSTDSDKDDEDSTDSATGSAKDKKESTDDKASTKSTTSSADKDKDKDSGSAKDKNAPDVFDGAKNKPESGKKTKDDATKDAPKTSESADESGPTYVDSADKTTDEKNSAGDSSDKGSDKSSDKSSDKNSDKNSDKSSGKTASEDKADDKSASAEKDTDGASASEKSAGDDKKAPKVSGKKGANAVKTASKSKKKKTATHAITSSSSSDSSSKSTEGGTTTESFTYNWDTAKTKDGNYLVRFTVDDRLSNPSNHESIVNLRSVTVDNTAPEIELIDYKRQPNGKIEFKVTAKDKSTSIANATYKIDDGEPFALSFDADSMDSLKATLLATDVKVESGSHKVEVKVSDRAGNTATKTITIK